MLLSSLIVLLAAGRQRRRSAPQAIALGRRARAPPGAARAPARVASIY